VERLSEKDLEVVWSAGAEGQKQRERRFLAPLVASWRPGLELIWTFQTVSKGNSRKFILLEGTAGSQGLALKPFL
jgi:hypothetical protein